jgi:hypothetical protein
MSWSGSSDVCFGLVLGRRRLSLLFMSLDFGILRWLFMYRQLVALIRLQPCILHLTMSDGLARMTLMHYNSAGN